MNRCSSPSCHSKRSPQPGWAFLLCFGLWMNGTALAQTPNSSAWVSGLQSQPMRTFPPKAARGQMAVVTTHDINLNGVPERLSPGARIRNLNNGLVMTGGLVGQTFIVNYVRDAAGLVHEVWILNEAEAAQRLPGAEATQSTNVVSGDNPAR